jgi:hypothetical protein
VHITAYPHAGKAIGGNKEGVIYLDETTGGRAAELFLAGWLWDILFGPIIDNQEEHHRQKSFKEELLELLEKYDVGYDENYLWD